MKFWRGASASPVGHIAGLGGIAAGEGEEERLVETGGADGAEQFSPLLAVGDHNGAFGSPRTDVAVARFEFRGTRDQMGAGESPSPFHRRLLWRAGLPASILLIAAVLAGTRNSSDVDGERRHADASAAALVSLVGGRHESGGAKAFCNGKAGHGHEVARSWDLPPATRSACYESLHQNYMGKEVLPSGRNWCWVGMKRYGCHSRLGYRLNWQELNTMAVSAGALNPPEPFYPLLEPDVCDRRELGITRKWSVTELQIAREWFYANVNVYVLNLPMNKIRWKFMKARLTELFIKATRIEGVDMRMPGALQAAKKEGLIPQHFNLSRAKVDAWKMGLGGILGRVGCASAHFRGQAAAMEESTRKPLAIIFEDDVWPEKDFIPRLWSLVKEELPCDWEAVSLSSKCPYGKCISPHLTRVQPDGNEPLSSCHGGVNYGFQGMLYRTEKLAELQAKWKEVVFDEGRPHCLDVDVALASISDRVVYYAVPFVQEPGFLSEIHMKSSREAVDSGASQASSCSAHPGCKDLIGDCCPTTAGISLGCCKVEISTCGDIESGIDFVVESEWGYSVNEIPSPDVCCELCQKEPQCKAWTWIKDAKLGGLFPSQCWLKGGLPTSKLKKDGVISGLQHSRSASAASDQKEDEEEKVPSTLLPGSGAAMGASQEEELASEEALGSRCPKIVNDLEYVVDTAKAWAVHADHTLSPDECCAKCNEEPLCESWTWVRNAHLPQGFPSQCWIKGGKTTGVLTKAGVVSGLRGRPI
eukprot:CAMPEP_0115188450 /NCGR_PEP_ID=MMETSP0270-20121206/11016_1 /TAXON_ID=71861 /ORGANISM="Scrippsiella trochoidea, Strain CCMP3099" /LENGTH=757 /DNA_ID=CAMNT_0002601631 /DNA_START=138 /DNA_END=2411 /DNA_ORIENTATION=-